MIKEQIVSAIEQYAVENRVRLIKAANALYYDPTYQPMFRQALGAWDTGTPPSRATIYRWVNQDKLFLAKRWPDVEVAGMTKEEIHRWIEAYLPVCKRPSARSQGRELNAAKFRDYRNKGISPDHIAEMFSISRATVYRWLKDPETPATTSP